MVGDFYETGIEIGAGFGPVGIAEKNWADFEQLLRPGFHVFMAKCRSTRGTSDQLYVCSYQLGRFLVEKLAIYFRLKVGKILST